MSFGQIGWRPPRRVVRVGMIEANNVLAALSSLALNANQIFGIDVVAVVQRVKPCVTRPRDGCNDSGVSIHLPQQNAAALVRISLLAVLANGVVVRLGHFQHWLKLRNQNSECRSNYAADYLCILTSYFCIISTLPPKTARSNICLPSPAGSLQTPPADFFPATAPPGGSQPRPLLLIFRRAALPLARAGGPWHARLQSSYRYPHRQAKHRKSCAQSRSPCASPLQSRVRQNLAEEKCSEFAGSTPSAAGQFQQKSRWCQAWLRNA